MHEICQIFKMRAWQSMFLKMCEFHGKCVKVGRAADDLSGPQVAMLISKATGSLVEGSVSLHWGNVERQRGWAKELLSSLWVWRPQLLFQSPNLIWVYFFFFFFHRIVSYFKPIIYTFYHYYYLLSIIFCQIYSLEKARHPSSIKFTTDFASHVLHSLLGTMFTVSVEVH